MSQTREAMIAIIKILNDALNKHDKKYQISFHNFTKIQTALFPVHSILLLINASNINNRAVYNTIFFLWQGRKS
jgi:hypothetical protein